MKVSVMVILVISRAFFAVYNLVIMTAALFGILPLTVFSGIQALHLSDEALIALLGLPASIAGSLSTIITRSRFWGMINAILAVALVLVEINFSVIVSYAIARDFHSILDVFLENKYTFLISMFFSLITPTQR